MSGFDHADRDDDRVTCVCLAWNRLINERDEMRCGRDWVDCRMGSRTVTAASHDLDREILTERRPRPRSNHYLAGGQVRVNVKRDDGVYPFQGALLHHFTSAAAGFFGRLKDASPGHRQWPRTIKGKRCPEKNRRVRVMTTRVHHSRFSRTVGDIAFLLDRQGIDIRSHGDDWRPGNGRFDDIRDNTALPWGYLMRNPSGGKLFAEIIRRREFFTAKFGVPMEVTPDPRESGDYSRKLCLNSP
jgi:hypothetical protein